MGDEDDLWLKGLAGEPGAQQSSEQSAHGAALRAAILGRTVGDAGEVLAIDPAREAALLARARTAGLLPATVVQAPPVSQGKRQAWRWVALAAALAGVAIGVSLQMRTQTGTVVLRGDASAVVHLRAADPLRLKQDLLRELNAVGVHATGYENLGLQGVDADLPNPLPDAVREVLKRHGVPMPAGNVLQIQIEPDSTR
jgi:hypothetical protein